MPDDIWALISEETGATTELHEAIPILSHLLAHDNSVARAYICSEHAVQMFKTRSEGAHFCGYRNIQMLLLALKRLQPGKLVTLSDHVTIPQLQQAIEKAWDAGYNAHGRIMTGGIIGTRKHIGTSEVSIHKLPITCVARWLMNLQAEALLLSLGIACTGHGFHGPNAWEELLDFVEQYFRVKEDDPQRPPLFLQRPAHSLTIIGIEILKSGDRRLLTFDPQWRPPSVMSEKSRAQAYVGLRRTLLLWRYRKSLRYLKRFDGFEVLSVDY
jgi:hypothetical protein